MATPLFVSLSNLGDQGTADESPSDVLALKQMRQISRLPAVLDALEQTGAPLSTRDVAALMVCCHKIFRVTSVNAFVVLACALFVCAHIESRVAIGQEPDTDQTSSRINRFESLQVKPIRATVDLPIQQAENRRDDILRFDTNRLEPNTSNDFNAGQLISGASTQPLPVPAAMPIEAPALPQLAHSQTTFDAKLDASQGSPVHLSVLPDLNDALDSQGLRPSNRISQNDSPVVILLWKPEFENEILTVDQLKQLAEVESTAGSPPSLSRSPADPGAFAGGKLVQASYQEQEKAADQETTQNDKKQEKQVNANGPDERIATLKEQVESKRKQISENEALDAATKSDANNQLNTAANWLQKATTANTYIQSESVAKENFEETIAALQEKLKEDLTAETPDPSASLDDLSAQLQARESRLQTLQASQKTIRTQITDRDKRVAQIATLRKTAENDLSETTKGLAELEAQPDDFNKPLSLLVLRSKRLALDLEAKSLLLESQRLEQTARSLPLERDQVERELKILQGEIDAWRAAVNRREQDEIRQQQEAAKKELENIAKYKNPELQAIATRSQVLANTRSELTNRTKQLSSELEDIKKQNTIIEQEQAALKAKIEMIGLTASTGMLLVEHRRNLMTTAMSQRRLSVLADELRTSQAKVIDLNVEREALQATDLQIESVVASSSKKDVDEVQLKLDSRALIKSQIKLINDLTDDYTKYHKKLFDVEVEHRTLIANINESKKFTDENALWVRSAKPIATSDVSTAVTGWRSFFNRSSWQQLTNAVGGHISKQPYESGLLALIIGGLFVIQRRLRWSHE
ncbi:MAG: hypothetical protein AAFN77_20025 [Planctomycetota bacterium]